MTEKVVKMKRIICDACDFVQVVEVPDGLFSKPKTPTTWGRDLKGADQLCPTCKNLYTSWYETGYKKWKADRKGKEGK